MVVKTKADYDGDSKKGKLRSPKIAEFSISIIEGVSERLKVRMMPLPAIVLRFIHHPISNMCLTLLLVHMPPEQTAISLQLRTFVIITPPPPFQVILPCSCYLNGLCLSSCRSYTQEDIMHNDSVNPALKRSLIQLLPWRWPPNGSIAPTSLNTPLAAPYTMIKTYAFAKREVKTYFWFTEDSLAYFKMHELCCAYMQHSSPAIKINRWNSPCEIRFLQWSSFNSETSKR